MPKVVFFTGLSDKALDVYIERAPSKLNLVPVREEVTDEKAIELVQDADVIMLHGNHLADSVYRSAKKVRLIQLISAGYDNVDLNLLEELGIPVANIGGANAQGVSELTITLMLAVYRKLVHLERAVRQGKWIGAVVTGFNIFELAEKTVGIIGLGNIGRMVAHRLQGFDTRILGYDVAPHSPLEQEVSIERASLEQLLKESDIVTMHIPLLSKTRHFIGEPELNLMKDSAILINTSRGHVVDEVALINALQRGSIRGAGLDVFHQEPINQDNPLLKMDNVVLTPHAAGGTYEGWFRRADFAFQNIQRVQDGKPALSLIHPE